MTLKYDLGSYHQEYDLDLQTIYFLDFLPLNLNNIATYCDHAMEIKFDLEYDLD